MIGNRLCRDLNIFFSYQEISLVTIDILISYLRDFYNPYISYQGP